MNLEKQNTMQIEKQKQLDSLVVKEFILTVIAVCCIVGAVAFVINNTRFTEQPQKQVVQEPKKELTQKQKDDEKQRRMTTAIILMAG